MGGNSQREKNNLNLSDDRRQDKKKSRWEIVFTKKNTNIEHKQKQLQEMLFKKFTKEKAVAKKLKEAQVDRSYGSMTKAD